MNQVTQVIKRPVWLEGVGSSVFAEFSSLALKTKAVNLGQGFPGWKPPQFVTDALVVAANDSAFQTHQYARPYGHVNLVNAISKLYTPLINRTLDPLTEIQITNGASGGLFVALLALLNPGDEVIIFSPLFDIYEGAVRRSEGKLIEVPLHQTHKENSSGWTFNTEDLRAAVTSKTKVILINTPHNPTGKIFTMEELESIAQVVRENENIVVITDEVYEFMIYDDKPFHRFCTIDGMWDRTLNISSAGKLFSVTGWKIGWIYGPQHLLHVVSLCSQFAWFSVNTPSQEAISQALIHLMDTNYLKNFIDEYKERRTKLMNALVGSGFKAILPESGFFCLADLSELKNIKNIANFVKSPETQLNWDKPLDWNFCRWLTAEIGVTAIPCSSFYFGENPPTTLIRFAFCKTDTELEKATELLKNLTKNYQLE